MNSYRNLILLSMILSTFHSNAGGANPQEPSSPQETTEQVVKNCSDAVVLIFVSDSSGKETGLGSGFIVSEDGKIVTNYHVIKDAQKALVKLISGAFFPVESVLASDPAQDLAVIKVSGRNLPTLTIGDSEKVQVGERVVAIGSPLGLETTVSDGIVSALRKESPGVSWIQTTAPASPGNSGGPLLRMNGTVAGVITWGMKSGQNLNFAATSNEVLTLVDRARNAKPLAADAALPAVIPSGRVWSSLTSGRDYKVRVDGDYIYTEWTNMPAELQGTSTFSRGELKRSGDIWAGHVRAYLPCRYVDKWTNQQRVNWVRTDVLIEITSLTNTRIEGRAQNYNEGIDCKKGTPKGQPTWVSFSWIPKE
jgi:S1-C subfamily serine protease